MKILSSRFVALLSLAVVLTGCMSRYNVHTTDGSIVTSNSKPHLNADKNSYIITDPSGNTVAIPAGTVTKISPQSMDQSSTFSGAGSSSKK